MTNTPKSNIRRPVLTDTANVPRDVGNVADDVDGRVWTICTEATPTDTRPTGSQRYDGAAIYCTDTRSYGIWDATAAAWRMFDVTGKGLTVRGTLNTLAGSSPGASARLFIQAGTNVLTTDANGYGSITFPTAFPNSLVTVVAMAGESPGGARHIITGPDTSLTGTLGSVSSFPFRVFNDTGTAVATTSIRINWIAIGH